MAQFFSRLAHKNVCIYSVLAFSFAVLLQIQTSFFVTDTYKGLRVGLTDVFIPFIGVAVALSLFSKRSKWPNFSVPCMIWWLVALVVVMTASVVNGYITNGFLSHWALVNKYIGFFLLLTYFLLGAWIATNAKDYVRLTQVIALGFTCFFVLVVFLSTVTLFLQPFIPIIINLPIFPWDGFVGNRNAYALVFLMSFLFIVFNYEKNNIHLPSFLLNFFWCFLPIFLIFNASRAGWICAFFIFLVFFMKQPIFRFKSIILFITLGVALAYGGTSFTNSNSLKEGDALKDFVEAFSTPESDLSSQTNRYRYIALEDSLEMFRSYNPLVGAGLGRYKYFQIEKRGEYIEVIDCTLLLLLAETGILGLLVFSAFFIICAYTLYRKGYKEDAPKLEFHRIMFIFLLLFGTIIAVVHEQMYARMLWFLMGLALAQPILKTDMPFTPEEE